MLQAVTVSIVAKDGVVGDQFASIGRDRHDLGSDPFVQRLQLSFVGLGIGLVGFGIGRVKGAQGVFDVLCEDRDVGWRSPGMGINFSVFVLGFGSVLVRFASAELAKLNALGDVD